jgi:hypothetical protein
MSERMETIAITTLAIWGLCERVRREDIPNPRDVRNKFLSAQAGVRGQPITCPTTGKVLNQDDIDKVRKQIAAKFKHGCGGGIPTRQPYINVRAGLRWVNDPMPAAFPFVTAEVLLREFGQVYRSLAHHVFVKDRGVRSFRYHRGNVSVATRHEAEKRFDMMIERIAETMDMPDDNEMDMLEAFAPQVGGMLKRLNVGQAA